MSILPLFVACQVGYLQVMKLLMKDERILVNQSLLDATTPFSIACEEGFHEIIEFLLKDERVAVNLPNDDEFSPLMFACSRGRSLVPFSGIVNGDRQIGHRKGWEGCLMKKEN